MFADTNRHFHKLSIRKMQFQVTITETNVSTVCFETEEEARQFMNEPDYDLCEWECIENKIELN